MEVSQVALRPLTLRLRVVERDHVDAAAVFNQFLSRTKEDLHVARALVKIFEPKGARLVSHYDGRGDAEHRLGSAMLTIGRARLQVSVQDRVHVASAAIHLSFTSEDPQRRSALLLFGHVDLDLKPLKAGAIDRVLAELRDAGALGEGQIAATNDDEGRGVVVAPNVHAQDGGLLDELALLVPEPSVEEALASGDEPVLGDLADRRRDQRLRDRLLKFAQDGLTVEIGVLAQVLLLVSNPGERREAGTRS